MRDIHVKKVLPFGFTWEQYWPGEVIIKRGKWRKYIKAPWHMTTVSTQWRMADGSWMEKIDWKYEEGKVFDGLFLYTHPETWRVDLPYEYKTNGGTVQRCAMTVWQSRTKRRPHWLRFLPICQWVNGIEFRFSEEMGSEAGSWKGGVVGSSQTMFSGETAEQCAARVMRERKWDR